MELEEQKKEIIAMFERFDPERIILFGSVARGDQDHMSDYDLIVVYQTEKRFLDRLKELYLNWTIPKPVDILAYTPSEFERMVEDSFFLQNVLQDGEVIYERG